MSQFIPITEICDFQGGTQPPKSEWVKEPRDGYVRMLQIRDFTQPEKDNVEYVVLKKNTKICKKEDVLIGRYGASIGKICTGLEGAYNVALIKTKPDLKKLDKKYLMHILKSENFQHFILNVGSRAAQAGFNKDDLTKFKILVPPLKTQKQIAQILDDAAALRDKTKQLLKEYDLLTQSIFLDMFGDPVINQKGWKKRKGLNYYDVKGRVGWKGYKKTDLREEGPIVLGATHIDKFGNIDITKSVHLTREKYLESPEIFIEKNDLIFVQRGNTIGKIGIVNFKIGEATINPVVLILRVIGDNNPFFLLHLMMNENLKKEVVDLNSGSAQPMITQKSIKEYKIIDVPIKLQNQFAEKIALIEKQKKLAKQELKESEDLFSCLLQKAFKGELV